MWEVGEIAKHFFMTAMVEFVGTSSFVSTLTTLLKMTREAAHSNLRPMLDCYHFWSGLSKFEDLDQIRPGELAHVHFRTCPICPGNCWIARRRLFLRWNLSPRMDSSEAIGKGILGSAIGCSCRSFNRQTGMNSHAAFAREPSR